MLLDHRSTTEDPNHVIVFVIDVPGLLQMGLALSGVDGHRCHHLSLTGVDAFSSVDTLKVTKVLL